MHSDDASISPTSVSFPSSSPVQLSSDDLIGAINNSNNSSMGIGNRLSIFRRSESSTRDNRPGTAPSSGANDHTGVGGIASGSSGPTFLHSSSLSRTTSAPISVSSPSLPMNIRPISGSPLSSPQSRTVGGRRRERGQSSLGNSPIITTRPLSDSTTTNFIDENSSYPPMTFQSDNPESPPAEIQKSGLQTHLYKSLINSLMPDVTVLAFGYKYSLHRVVLAQTGYFETLFTGDWKDNGGIVDLGLNQTSVMNRASFEFLLVKLYGGTLELKKAKKCRTNLAEPLTKLWEDIWSIYKGEQDLSKVIELFQEEEESKLDNVMEVDATFLLGLLSISTYLEVEFLQFFALNWINETISPFTVSQYLKYSLGQVTNNIQSDQGCTGLEGVGKKIEDQEDSRSRTTTANSSSTINSNFSTTASLFVSAEGQKVGEAASCYLSKWSYDIFEVEEWLTKNLGSDFGISVWKDLSPRWTKAIISSDTFFISGSTIGPNGIADGEMRRFLFATKVVEFKREQSKKFRMKNHEHFEENDSRNDQDSVIEDGDSGKETDLTEEESDDEWDFKKDKKEEDQEYDELFATGIHYSHLTFDQLSLILREISPTTHRPFTPATFIHRAFFNSTAFISKIPKLVTSSTTHSNYSAPVQRSTTGGTVIPGESESSQNLGLALSAGTVGEEGPGERQFLIPLDDTSRINDLNSISGKGNNISTPKSEETFFGLMQEVILSGQAGELDRFVTKYEPLRFSFEFMNIFDLGEKNRAYSDSFFFAGSIYNIYLQKIAKKNSNLTPGSSQKASQLGIYLHRQNHNELFPPSSISGSSGTSLLFGSTNVNSNLNTKMIHAPYRDSRKVVQAFFSIWASNQVGNSLTRFSSAVDSYSISQSWGFKSTQLRSTEYLGSVGEGRFAGTLRVSIVLGLV